MKLLNEDANKNSKMQKIISYTTEQSISQMTTDTYFKT